jgi:hypothetical protein
VLEKSQKNEFLEPTLSLRLKARDFPPDGDINLEMMAFVLPAILNRNSEFFRRYNGKPTYKKI